VTSSVRDNCPRSPRTLTLVLLLFVVVVVVVVVVVLDVVVVKVDHPHKRLFDRRIRKCNPYLSCTGSRWYLKRETVDMAST
jgi:hypothetical protein